MPEMDQNILSDSLDTWLMWFTIFFTSSLDPYLKQIRIFWVIHWIHDWCSLEYFSQVHWTHTHCRQEYVQAVNMTGGVHSLETSAMLCKIFLPDLLAWSLTFWNIFMVAPSFLGWKYLSAGVRPSHHLWAFVKVQVPMTYGIFWLNGVHLKQLGLYSLACKSEFPMEQDWIVFTLLYKKDGTVGMGQPSFREDNWWRVLLLQLHWLLKAWSGSIL